MKHEHFSLILTHAAVTVSSQQNRWEDEQENESGNANVLR